MPAVALAPVDTQVVATAPAGPPQENTILPALRGDLVITRQKYEGRTYYVIKDPISLQYFRLSAEDYFLATLFDGRRTFGQIREALIRQYPHTRVEQSLEELNERVLRFANDLALLQFLRVQGQRLKARFESQRKQKAKKGWFFNLVNQVFFKRFSVWDPDVVLGRMAKPLGWLYTPAAWYISLAIIALALVIFGLNVGRISPSLEKFFEFENILLIWVTTIVIKAIHELGHGLTCKHFGGEVHEVGIMFMVFTPYFFVNVSDSWVLPERRHRILISAAGIYVELILAAFATFAWAFIQPGWLQSFFWNVMVIASLYTLIFNANPLMRFDGYYILTDWMEIPNLQGKSRALISHQIKELLFGNKGGDQTLSRMPLPRQRFWLFYIYAVASYIYGYYVTYSLTWFMSDQLAQYDLKNVGRFLAISAVLAWIIMPFWAFFRGLQLKREDWNPHGRLRRLALILSVVLGAFTALCFIPWELTIKRTGVVQLADPEAVRPKVEGFVSAVFVAEGEAVQAGQPLAQLFNRDLQQRLVMAEQRLRIAEGNAQRALGLDKPAEVRQAEAERSAYESRLAEARRDIHDLTLRATGPGTVLSRDLNRHIGRALKQNDLFCEIGRLDPMLIKVALSQKQVRYVQAGQKVEITPDSYPHQTITGTIKEVHPIYGSKDLPAALSALRGGDVAVKTDEHGQEVPVERTYEARIEVQNANGVLRPGMTSHGRIYTGKRPWGHLAAQSVLDLISLDFRF